MPAAIPIILAVTGLVSTGLGVYGAVKGATSSSSDPYQKMLQQQQQQEAQDKAKAAEAERQQKIQMLMRAAPDAQAQTGGSLTDSGFASLVSNIAGLPSDVNLAEELLKPGGPAAAPATTGSSGFNITPNDSGMASTGSPFGAGTQRGMTGVSGNTLENLNDVVKYLSGGEVADQVAA